MNTPHIQAGQTITQVLRQSPLPQLEARILIGHALGLSKVQLILQAERAFTTDEADKINSYFTRRLAGEPIAYLTGEREFYGLSLHVTPAVLIPRPETELLVDLSIERLPKKARVLDLGTGSGAIAIAIAHARPDAQVTAIDASADALAIARQNASRHQVNVRLLQSDWYAALNGERFDLIVANPPYIADGDAHLAQGDLRFEPPTALTDFADGLQALRIIFTNAAAHLESGGWLLMEHGYDQSEQVRAMLNEAGFGEVQSWCDLAGIERVSGGRL